MRPLYLKLINFMNHEKSEVDFTKLNNASVIVGVEDNNDSSSNGAGKTNFLHAFKYVLFDSKVCESKEDIIKYGSSSCLVEFTFQIKDQVYKIQRKKTKSSQSVEFSKLEGDKFINLSGRTSTQTNNAILEVLKINEATFENVGYLKQNDYTRRKVEVLPAATPTERKYIIIDMLQLNEWSKYEKAAKQLRDEALNNFSINEELIKSLGRPEEEIERCENELVSIDNNLVDLNQSIEKATLSLADKKLELSTLESNKVDESQLLSSLKTNTQAKTNLSNEIKKLTNLLQEKDTTKLKSTIDSKIKERTNVQNQLDSLIDLNKPDYDLVQTLSKDIAFCKNSIYEQDSLIKRYSQKIPEDDYCPSCGSEIKTNREHLLNEKTNNLNEAKSKKSSLTSTLNDLNKSKENVENEIQKYESFIKSKANLTASIQTIEQSIKSNTELLEQNKQLLVSIQQNIDSKKSELEQINNTINDISTSISELNTDEQNKKIQNCKNELNSISAGFNQLKKQVENNLLKKGEYKKTIELKNLDIEKIASYKELRKSLDSEKALYKAACSCFSSSGIPSMIIHTVLDELQKETNKILSILKPKIQLKFIVNKERDDGSIADTLDIVYYHNNMEQTFSQLSGGQQGCVVLAIKLAMANVSRRRCGADIKLLLLDEIDQPLDETSTANLYEVIKEMSKEVCILVITHNKVFQDKFASKIKIENNNGSAYIKM